MGAVGLPFADKNGNDVQVLYGLVGQGTGKLLVQDYDLSLAELPEIQARL